MPLRKIIIITTLVSILLLIINIESSFAANLPFRLVWERNSESDVAFYTVYYGTSSRNYSHFVDVGQPQDSRENPHADFCDRTSPDCDPSYAQITPGTYYLTVTATDFHLNESDFSVELVVHIDPSPPSATTTSTIGPTAPSPTTTTTAAPTDSTIYEDAEDRTIDRWYIYDASPSGAEIRNVYDDDRQSRVMQFSSSGIDNGFRLTNSAGERWHNSNQFSLQWSMNFSESFTIYIDLETTAGHRYLTYTPHDYNNLGYGEYVEHGLGSDAINGQWHTFVRDLAADLAQSQQGVRILEVNGFLIRGSGKVDDIMLLNDSPSPTTPITSDRDEYCSRDPQLQLNGSPPEEGTMNIVIPAGSLPQDSLSYEDAEDGTTGRWTIYDDSPGGAEIRNVYDDGRRSRVIEFSGAGWDNGYRLTNSDGTFWNNDTHFIIKWSMQYAELFTLYIDLETTVGHRYLTYRPNDYNSLGNDEYVLYGLGENAMNGQWHTFVRDLQADLAVAQPGVTILEVNGFLIRGSGKVDDVTLITLQGTIHPNLHLTLFNSDTSGEGNMYVNGNGPILVPSGNYTDREHTFQIPVNPTCLIEGENSFRFTHVANQGYEVRELCIGGLFKNTPTAPPSVSSAPRPDKTPPTGMITINQGDSSTFYKLVTLSLSAKDTGSGMGVKSQMMLSNDNQNWIGPKPFALTKFWVLPPGKGNKTVYAKFCDERGNWMNEPVSDSIELQLTCPKPLKLDAAAIASSGAPLTFCSEDKAVDGKITSGWLSPLRHTLQDEHIILDLGRLKVINRIDICSNPLLLLNLFPRDFKIQGSIDNQHWVDLVSVTGYTPPLSHTDSWSFDNAEVRYVQVVVTRPRKFLFFFYAAYIAEIKVFGCPELEAETPEVPTTSALSQTGIQLKKQTPDTQEKENRQSEQRTTTPGRPGRPVFILNGKP